MKNLKHRVILAWLMWAVLSLFYAYQYILRIFPSLAMQDMMQRFSIGAQQFGQYAGIYYIGYALAHIPLGIAIDKLGAKRVLTLAVLIVVLGMYPVLYSQNWALVVLGRLMIGMASAASTLGLIKIVRVAFGEEKFSSVVGLAITVGMMGAMCGGPLSALINKFGLFLVLNVILVVGFGLAVLVMITIPGSQKLNKTYPFVSVSHDIDPIAQDNETKYSMISDFKQVLFNYRLILIGIAGGLMIGPLEGFIDGWGIVFGQVTFNLTQSAASNFPTFLFLGALLGFPMVGWMSDTARSYYGVIIITGLIMLFGCVAMLMGIGNVPFSLFGFECNVLYILMFLIGISCGYQMPVLAKANLIFPNRLSTFASAVANMVMMGFGTFFHTVIGGIVEHKMQNSAIDPLSSIKYTKEALFYGLSVIPICLLLGVIIFGGLALHERCTPKN